MSSRRRALGLSLADGALYSFMGGIAESYIAADMVRLRATAPELVATAVLPALSGAMAAHRADQRFGRVPRRRVVVYGVLMQAAQLAALAIAASRGLTTPLLLLVFACSQQALASFIATAWLTWFGQLVPTPLRPSYFARRAVCGQLAGFCGIVVGGSVLQVSERRWGAAHGFAFNYAVGAASLCAGAYCLVRSWDGPRPVAHRMDRRDGGGVEPCSGVTSRAGRLRSIPFMQLAIALGTPFVAPLMLQQLGFSYLELMLALAVLTGSKSLALPVWGRLIGRWGARNGLSLSLLGSIPAGAAWLWTSTFLGALTTQAMTGVAMAGYELSVTALLLGAVPLAERSALLARMATQNGVATFVGGLLGYAIVSRLPGAFALALAASACARVLACLLSFVEARRAPAARLLV